MSLNKNKCHVHVKINGMVEFKRLFYFILYELNYCHIHCWCKNTRCSRALLCPGADTQQELMPPTPKTTPPRLAHCQLAFSHRVLSSFSDPPSWPLYDYQQLVKKNVEFKDLLGALTATALTHLDHINPLSCLL